MNTLMEGYRPDDEAFTSDSSFDDDIDNISLLPDIQRKPNRLRRRKIRLFTDRSFDFNGRMCSKTLVYTSVTAALLVSVVLISIFVKPSSSEEFEESLPEKRSQLQDGPILPPEDNDEKLLYKDKNGKVFPWQKIRLPSNLVPMKYLVEIHPDLKTFKFTGSVEMLVKCNEKTNFVFFHSKHLDLTKIQVYEVLQMEKKLKKLGPLKLGKIVDCPKLEMVSVEVPGGFQPGEYYVIHVEFSASLADKLFGFYKSSYKNKKGETRYLATTHFEPTDARAAFPCFDEPALKATFEMIIIRDPLYTALSNMPLNRTEPYTSNDGQKWEKDYFEESVKMSTYLIAFVVCDFKSLEDKTSSGIKVRVWAPPDDINDAKFALQEAKNVLSYYEVFFKVKFPLPKQDLIAIPDFAAGAMENWGLITYRSTSLLYNEKESSDSNKQWVATVVAHELAHQWFGNLVTMKWWNDLWLNEGFASYVESVGASYDNPEWKMLDQFLLDKTLKAMNLDQMSNSHPISVVVHNPNEINALFDTISYDKGASIIRMLRSFIGKKAFQHGLQTYLQQHKFGNAETKDLWGALSAAWKEYDKNNAKDISQIMDTWTLQMGFPVVTIKQVAGKGVATQAHFLVHPRAKPAIKSPLDYKWTIPLTYITQENKQFKQVWMGRQDPSVEIDWPQSSGWIKANYGQKGFYRVNYEKGNWDKLTQQLEKNHKVLSDADRAGMIDDAFNLARAGHLKVTTALDLTKYLTLEKEYVPWVSTLSNIGYLHSMVCSNKADYDILKKYMSQQLRPIFNELGWEDRGSHLQKYLRVAVIKSSSVYGIKTATVEALKMFNDWKTSGKPIAPNLRGLIYSIGVREGGEDAFDFVLNQFKKVSQASENKKLMFALTATKEPKVIDRLLKMSLDKTIIRSQDSVSIINSVAGNCHARIKALEFVQHNWKELSDRYSAGSFDFSRLITSTMSHFNTDEKFKKIKHFLGSHTLGSGKRAAQQTLESIRANIDWMKSNKKEALKWMKDHTGQQPSAYVKETIQEIEDLAQEQPNEDHEEKDYQVDRQDSQYERNYYYQQEEPRYDNDGYFRDSGKTGDYYNNH